MTTTALPKSKYILSTLLVVFFLVSFLLFSYTALASSSGTLLPVSDGNYKQWTPSTGTSHFALVDETPCNTTDYNSTIVVGQRDSYTVSSSSVPNGATITQIDIKPCASRVSTGGTNPVMNVFYRLNGVNSADMGSYPLAGATPVELGTTTFSGLSTVKLASTTLEVGAVLTSSTKGARLSRIATTITYNALTAPSTLTGIATTTSVIALSWTDTSSNESGFTLERSTDGLNWTAIATTSSNTTSYNNSGLSPATTYYHRVRAYNAGAYTSFSNVATTTTNDVTPIAPSSLGLTRTPAASSTTDIVLAWTDNSANESGFKIERSTGGAFTQIATTAVNTVSYSDASMINGTYTYRIRAYNGFGSSAYSASASTTVPVVGTPVVYWKLDGNSSDAVAGNNGTDANITYATSTGKILQGASFNGSTAKIDVGHMLSGTVNVSVAAWVKAASSTASLNYIVSQRDSTVIGQWDFFLCSTACAGSSAGKVVFFAEGGGNTNNVAIGNTAVDDGNWHHIGVAQSGNTYTFYLDGVENGSVTSGTVVSYDASAVGAIGYDRRDSNSFFNGAIDEVGVWNTTLSATDFAALYNSGVGRPFSTF